MSTTAVQREAKLAKRLKKLEDVLRQIRALSNYPGKDRSNFVELAGMRRKVNKLACDALREEG